ncbi:MAG: hypothetical protein LWX56_00365 [Ignavibacteria bacterium]|nr:hypothetical protein [Ignavibacteria bacterium]
MKKRTGLMKLFMFFLTIAFMLFIFEMIAEKKIFPKLFSARKVTIVNAKNQPLANIQVTYLNKTYKFFHIIGLPFVDALDQIEYQDTGRTNSRGEVEFAARSSYYSLYEINFEEIILINQQNRVDSKGNLLINYAIYSYEDWRPVDTVYEVRKLVLSYENLPKKLYTESFGGTLYFRGAMDVEFNKQIVLPVNVHRKPKGLRK